MPTAKRINLDLLLTLGGNCGVDQGCLLCVFSQGGVSDCVTSSLLSLSLQVERGQARDTEAPPSRNPSAEDRVS